MSIPAQAIADAKAASSTLWPVLLAVAKFESAFDPKALGDYKLVRGGPLVPRNTPGAFPTSFGYLQMYTDGGLGNGHPVEKLLDGAYNMKLGADYIQGRLTGGATLYEALRPWSVRDLAVSYLPEIAIMASNWPVPVDQSGILESIDTLWGISKLLDQQADNLKGQAQRVRDYVILIKRAAGLE